MNKNLILAKNILSNYMNTPQIDKVKYILNNIIQENQIYINKENLYSRITKQENLNHLTQIVNGNKNISKTINGISYPLYKNNGSNIDYSQNLGNILTDINQGTHDGDFQDLINDIINILELKPDSNLLIVDLENIHSQIVKVVKKSLHKNNPNIVAHPPTIYPILRFMKLNNCKRVIFVYKDPNKWGNISFLLYNILSARDNNGNINQNSIDALPPPNLHLPNNLNHQIPSLDEHIIFLKTLSAQHFIGIDLSSSPQSRPPQLFQNYKNLPENSNKRIIQKLYYGFDDLICFSIASFLHAIQIPTAIITYDVKFNLNEYKSYFQNISSDFPILAKLKKLKKNGQLDQENNSKKYLASLNELNYEQEIKDANIDNTFNIIRIDQQQQFIADNYQKKYKSLPKETIIKNLNNLVKLIK